jgi:hypothetical protein
VKLRLTQPAIGTILSVAAAVAVTGTAMRAPPKPHKARDFVSFSRDAVTDVCAMYPAECRFNAENSATVVVGRRIVPGDHTQVLRHFGTVVGAAPDQPWEQAQ